MAIKSKRDALATHLMLDIAETEDYRYHYGLTSQPVYAFTDCYYCITKGSQKPATHRDGMEWKWVEVKDEFINTDGYKIWKAMNRDLTDDEIKTKVEHLANAFATYQQCFGHHKADMNEQRVKRYKQELTDFGIPFPSDKELGKIGVFNGGGAF